MKHLLSIFAALSLASGMLAQEAEALRPLLIQQPAVSKDRIAFVFAGDIWTVPRAGGEATRLTSDVGRETSPRFSPDGTQLAFTGEYDGNVDVFVMPVKGGAPRRLTSHPAGDVVMGWTPDGKRVLFVSNRESANRDPHLYTVPVEGGFPERLPLPRATAGSLSPDGRHLAYMPYDHFQKSWKRYRGGSTPRIWIADLSDSSVVEIPRQNSNDSYPMWAGGKVWFLSDREGSVTLFSYDSQSKRVTREFENKGFDIKSASEGPDAIVLEQFGAIHLFDLKTGSAKQIAVNISADMPHTRARFKTLSGKDISKASISPSGARIVIEARGEILSAPAEKGDVRNLSSTTGVMERDPAWSPDGRHIAYLSDEGGEYQLHIVPARGGEARKIALGEAPSFYYEPVWSPDSKKIAYHDKRLNLWVLEVESGESKKIDTDIFEHPERGYNPAWSPDSKHIAYTRQMPNHFRAVFIYSVDDERSQAVTDGMSDCRYPVFDRSGKYLYFTASTDLGLAAGWLNMSALYRPVTRSVYAVVLDKELPSPVAPEEDDEKTEDKKSDEKSEDKKEKKENGSEDEKKPGEEPESKTEKKTPKVKIDFEEIGQRIVSLPVPARNYVGLETGKEGILYLSEAVPVPTYKPDDSKLTIQRFDLAKRKVDKMLEGVTQFMVSANGEKALYRKGDDWQIASAGEKPEGKNVKLDGMAVYIDPRAEWKQMYREAWRIQRDFMYDPNFHGLNLANAEQKYLPYLDGVASRSDLTYLLEECLGELTLGHVYVRGGEAPETKRVKGGLLGADYTLENGRYRFARIYNGENWNPDLRAPLTQPGVNVKPGDYLIAVRGREIRDTDEIYSFFEETAGKTISIKVSANPDGADAREVSVVPVENEFALRRFAWIEGNRRKVDELSNGRLAYVYLPNTSVEGYSFFSRYYFAQIDKQGAILDERYNGGGSLADYIIDHLRRPHMSRLMTRQGQDYSEPLGTIIGPKVMIINEYAGSGGDAMPWYFRKAGVGKLVGTRTWGGLVGIYDYPPLMDGGMVTAPRIAIYGLEGEWEVENIGIAPDIEVPLDPKAWREGRDSQLEKAVEIALRELEANPPPEYKRPAFPNYHSVSGGK
jgi:tricorn protease